MENLRLLDLADRDLERSIVDDGAHLGHFELVEVDRAKSDNCEGAERVPVGSPCGFTKVYKSVRALL